MRTFLFVFSLILAGAWQSCTNAVEDPATLFANYFVPVDNMFKPTTKRQVPETVEEKAFVEYDRKNYPEAARWLKEIKEPEAGHRFYLATSLMASQQETAATPILEVLIKEDQIYKPITEWYLALCYVKESKTDKAKALLDFISNTPVHPYQKQATQLMSLL